MASQVEIRNRIREIVEDLQNDLSVSFIIHQYTSEWGVSARTVERYIAVATEMVNKKLDEEDTLIHNMRSKIIREEAESKLRSNMELEAHLIHIIEGDMETRTEITHSGGRTLIKTKPTRREVLKAIDLLWKRRGMLHTKPVEQHTHSFIMVRNQEEEDIVKMWFKNMTDEGPQTTDPKQFEPYTIEGTGGLIDGTKLIDGRVKPVQDNFNEGVPPLNPDITT